MDPAAERSTATDFQQGGQVTPVRRRLVQSTLFPNNKRRRLFEDEKCKIDKVDDEELKCSNDNKYMKKNNKRNSPKPKATPRASKQVAVNGKEMPIELEDGCIRTEESDVILKKKLEEEHICISPENEKACMSPNSPISTRTRRREKRRTKYGTSPKDNVIRNMPKVALFKKAPHELVLEEPKLPVVPDLRSEAKLTAEENSRLFAGRPLHPFFSSRKTSKRNQEIIELENSQWSLESREGIPLCPIHVLEAAEGDAVSLNWGQWEFSTGMCLSTSSGLGPNCSSFVERFVSSLQIDDFTSPNDTSTCQNKDKEVDGIDSTQTFFSCMSSAAEFQRKFLPKGSCNQVENSLWTDKYQPRYASQICGNGESVKFINEWLYYWRKKNCQSSFEGEKNASQDAYNSCGQSETDSECCDDETSVKNVLLITGPVGSGKSAAIYACAQEQGFQVIEVNASDWRNGALVKQRFGEALESHRHQNKVDSATISKKSPAKSLFGITAKYFEDEVEMITLSHEENSQASGTPNTCSEKQNGALTDQSETKTLILFEDVDATLSEDHGFLSTIQQLALTAKRPMILTSNENGSVLPKNLERLEAPFEIPSMKELLGLGRVVCDAEKANIHPCLIDRCVEYFQGDIRKTILHLQFWCQGRSSRKGAATGITYSPLLFDLDAGHRILPKLVPLGFPSHLSEYVEEEIAKSLISVEKHHSSLEVVAEQNLVNCEIKIDSGMDGDEFNYLETKKRAMLSLSSSFFGEEELLARPGCTFEFSDTSGSPVAFAKRGARRKFRAVISSDSEEEGQDKVPLGFNVSPGEANDNILGVTTSPRLSFSSETLCGLSTEQHCHSEGYQEEQKSSKVCETSFRASVLEDCNSADISSVPESVFIPEAEINDEAVLFSATVSYNPFCFTDADSINSLFPNLSTVKDEQVCEPFQKNQEMLGRIDDIGDTMMLGELLGVSHIEHEDNFVREYQTLDECSRCDFATVVNTSEKPGFDLGCNVVEETWKRLRECHRDLQQHVTPDYKDSLQAMKLSYKMSNLISESDLLHIHYQPHVDDPSVPSRWLGEVLPSYRWSEDQEEMASVVAQHGLCSYAKEAAALVAGVDSSSRVNLAFEMLSSSSNPMALGKLLYLNKAKTESTDTMAQLNSNLERRKTQSPLRSLCRSVVSPKAYLALEGDAFHEYLSALSQISRFEAGRLSQPTVEKKRRRSRGSQHYLSSGSYMLSPLDISMLDEFNCLQKVASQYRDSSIG